MKKKRKVKYDITKILSKNCRWMFIIGMRSNGKSFEVKYDAISRAYKEGKKFAYVRRWDTDIKAKAVDSYFDDMKEASNGYKAVEDITNGEWLGVTAYQGYLYFYRYDEKGKTIRSQDNIGRYLAVNMAEHYKSQTFIGYGTLLYEEVLTNKIYVTDEPHMLMNLVSTIFRDEDEDVRIYLVANTISRVSPYISEWGLNNIPNQKPDTIDVYHLTREDGTVVDFAVQNTEVIETKSKLFFGNSQKQIQGGEWETKDVPKLQKPLKYYEHIYDILVDYDHFKFRLMLLGDNENGGFTVYIYPYNGKKKFMRIVTDKYSTSPFITPFIDPKFSKAEKIIVDCFRKGKVAFSDNLTGSDFNGLVSNYRMGV